MPIQFILPRTFEYVGCSTHKVRTELALDTDETWRRSGGNDRLPDTAFSDWSVLETRTVVVNESPT